MNFECLLVIKHMMIFRYISHYSLKIVYSLLYRKLQQTFLFTRQQNALRSIPHPPTRLFKGLTRSEKEQQTCFKMWSEFPMFWSFMCFLCCLACRPKQPHVNVPNGESRGGRCYASRHVFVPVSVRVYDASVCVISM